MYAAKWVSTENCTYTHVARYTFNVDVINKMSNFCMNHENQNQVIFAIIVANVVIVEIAKCLGSVDTCCLLPRNIMIRWLKKRRFSFTAKFKVSLTYTWHECFFCFDWYVTVQVRSLDGCWCGGSWIKGLENANANRSTRRFTAFTAFEWQAQVT